MSKVVEGLRYSEDHEWVKVEGGIAVIGISDFAQKELGDITYADLPEVDDEVEAGEEFGALESVKASSELLSLCPERLSRSIQNLRTLQRRSTRTLTRHGSSRSR